MALPGLALSAFALFMAALLSSPNLSGAESDFEPALILSIDGAEQVLFDHKTAACEEWDIPDAPARAYRDAAGDIHLFQTHYQNRALVGSSFSTLRRRCPVVFKGNESRNPADFSDRAWIAATYTLDGKTVYGLVHNEFQSNRWADICPSREYMKCWYNSLTAVVSHDAGESFSYAKPRLVAALPFRADQTQGQHAGFFGPSNIVRWQGAYYFMAHVVSPKPQAFGTCLFRSTDVSDPQSWRMWRNGAFETRPADPYAGPVDPEQHRCDPLNLSGLPWPVGGIVRHEASGNWIAVMAGLRKMPDGRQISGIFYSTSQNLIRWSRPAQIMDAPVLYDRSCGLGKPVGYPALLDPESRSRNFETLDGAALLTFTRFNPVGCHRGPSRDLIGVRVTIQTKHPPASK